MKRCIIEFLSNLYSQLVLENISSKEVHHRTHIAVEFTTGFRIHRFSEFWRSWFSSKECIIYFISNLISRLVLVSGQSFLNPFVAPRSQGFCYLCRGKLSINHCYKTVLFPASVFENISSVRGRHYIPLTSI